MTHAITSMDRESARTFHGNEERIAHYGALVPELRKEGKTKLCLPAIVITNASNDVLEPYPDAKKPTVSRENGTLLSSRRRDTEINKLDALVSDTDWIEKKNSRILVANKRKQVPAIRRENSDPGGYKLSVCERKNLRRHSTSSLTDNLALLNSLTQQRQNAINNLGSFQTEVDCTNCVSYGVTKNEMADEPEKTVDQFLSKGCSTKCNISESTADVPRKPLTLSYRNVLPGTDHQYNSRAGQRLLPLKKSDVLYRQKGAPSNCKDRLFERSMNSALHRHLNNLRSQYNTATLLQIEDTIKDLTHAKHSK